MFSRDLKNDQNTKHKKITCWFEDMDTDLFFITVRFEAHTFQEVRFTSAARCVTVATKKTTVN